MIAVVALVVVAAGSVAGFVLLRGGSSAAPVEVSGDLLARVQRLVDQMPAPESGGYDVPSRAQASAMASAFQAMRDGDLGKAAGLARPFGYTVQRFTDTATGRHLVVLAETQNADGSWPHAWGLYVWSPDATSKLVVEVAHALDDINTPPIGVATFRLANAQALLVAGASRFADPNDVADVAHTPGTVFDAIHHTLLGPGVVVFQPHGFDTTAHFDYGDVVVSSGDFPPQPLARSMAGALRAAGFRVCLYDGSHCSALGATTNVEGASTREAGDQFVHVEMAAKIRNSPRLGRLVAEAVARAAG